MKNFLLFNSRARIIIPISCGVLFIGLFFSGLALANEVKQYEIPIDSTVNEVFFSVSFTPKNTKRQNDAYDLIAKSTGGQSIKLGRSEVSVPEEYIRTLTKSNMSLALHVNDELLENSTREIVVISPSGKVVTPTDKDAVIKQWSNGQYVKIKNPQPGVWHLHVSGQGAFSALAHVDSPIFIYDHLFIKRIGAPEGHHLAQKIEEEKKLEAGKDVLLRVKMSGNVSYSGMPELELITPAGKIIRRYKLQHIDQTEQEAEILLKIETPKEAFRFQVSGVDKKNMKYRRIREPLFLPK